MEKVFEEGELDVLARELASQIWDDILIEVDGEEELANQLRQKLGQNLVDKNFDW